MVRTAFSPTFYVSKANRKCSFFFLLPPSKVDDVSGVPTAFRMRGRMDAVAIWTTMARYMSELFFSAREERGDRGSLSIM